jgi:hypothetical protein
MTNIDMNIERELSDEQLELVSGGEDKAPPPPPQTCVQSCERVPNTTIVVCSPVICF